MATVTGYTAARMKQIEDAAIIDGEVVGNNLILEPRGFATAPATYPKIDAGNVRGPQGDRGPVGEVTDAELAAGLAATRVPAGTILMWGGDTAPTGYLPCDGTAPLRATYPDLFAAIGTRWGVGNGTTTFNLPNFSNRFPTGKGPATWSDALNEKGGSTDAVLVEHQHNVPNHQHSNPAHQHSVPAHDHDMRHGHAQADVNWNAAPHTHSGQTTFGDGSGAHNHYIDEYGTNQYLTQIPGGGGAALQLIPGSSDLQWHFDVGSYGEQHWHNFTTGGASDNANHGHTVTVPEFIGNVTTKPLVVTPTNEGATTTPSNQGGTTTPLLGGSPVALMNLPPFITVNFIIKA